MSCNRVFLVLLISIAACWADAGSFVEWLTFHALTDSDRMGLAIPNPFLREERPNNWEAGDSRTVGQSVCNAGAFRRSSQFATVGPGGTVEVLRTVRLNAGIGNLLDCNYFLIDGYPEIGRNTYINLG